MARAHRSALALACAAATLAVGHALTSSAAAAVPCASVLPSSPAALNCDATYIPTPYYDQMKAGTINLAALGLDTNGGCDFIEDQFEETFSSPVLNTTRWLPEELDGQEHCIGLPPAGNTTCTMMMSSQVKLAQNMPAQLGGGTGAILTLSQDPCNDPANPGACCNRKGNCAYWAGAHLVSAGCIHYGVLELEAAFNMPANAGGFYFTATYVVYGSQDPAWNEIDIGMINNVLGQLEFHATVFTASKSLPTATLMDALNFAQVPIGTSINVNTSIRAINGAPAPMRFYNTSFATQFHTYKIVWTTNTVAWMVDTVVYRNISFAPWRPMSIRQILRTNKGINARGPQFGASNIYIRRLRYTPLSPQAVADAYRCTSMFACYGALPSAPMGTATAYVSLASTAAPGAGRRHLLQTVVDSGAMLSAAVATVSPGLPADDVVTTATAFGLSFRLTLQNLNPLGAAGLDAVSIFQQDGLQEPLVSGVADDVIPPPANVMVQGVSQDATDTLLYVNVLVTGYATASDMLSDYSMFAARGAAELDATAAALNNALGLAANAYITASTVTLSTDPSYTPTVSNNAVTSAALLADVTLCPSYPASFDATCVDANGNPPAVWCADCLLMGLDQLQMVTTYAVAVPVAASAVDKLEASLSSAISSGALASAVGGASRRRALLQLGGGNTSLTTTNDLLLQRIISAGSDAAAAQAGACAVVATREKQWQAAAIAFIVAFGLLIVALVAFNAGKRTERAAPSPMYVKYPEISKMTTDTLA